MLKSMQSIDSKYTVQFYCNQLSQTKWEQLIQLAVQLRNRRNQVSEYFNNNLIDCINMSKFDFIVKMRQIFPKISGYIDQDAYTRVYTDYQNRKDSLIKKINFRICKFKGVTYYKRNCKSGKKGDVKGYKFEYSTTDLTKTLTWLARYYKDENSLSFIIQQCQLNNDKQEYYLKIARVINKFGIQKLHPLALRRRERVLSKYKKPIEYKSLTFTGYSHYKRIKSNIFLGFNKNYNSIIKAFIELSLPFGIISIPVKYSKDYHNSISWWKSNIKKYISYTITFDEYNKNLNILICRDGQRLIPENKTNYVGVDINTKHNLLACSNGLTFDFNRTLASKLFNLYNETDVRELTIEEEQKLKSLKHKLLCSCNKTISEACKKLKDIGVDHLVVENNTNSFKKSKVKSTEFDINQNRLMHVIQFGSIKNKIESIARKYDIQVSFVHPDYTSQTCPICGCIEPENRLNQEEFSCCNCGYSANADLNAAINIQNRVVSTVLRDKLLNQNQFGAYLPKKIEHSKFKDKLASCMKEIYKLHKL